MGFTDDVFGFMKDAMKNPDETTVAGFKGDMVSKSIKEEELGTIIELETDAAGNVTNKTLSDSRDNIVVAEVIYGKDLPVITRDALSKSISLDILDDDIIVQSNEGRMFLMHGPIYPAKLLEKMQSAELKTPQEVEISFKAAKPDISENMVEQLMESYRRIITNNNTEQTPFL